MLVGLVDPSHEERKKDEPGRLPRWYTPQEILARAATEGPSWSPWPYELIQAAIDQYQERDFISVSMLTGGCARSKVIERREDFVLWFDDLYPALRGTQIHRTLEAAARPNSVSEWRFFTTVRLHGREVELSCSPDIVTWNPNTLGDYKVTENPPDFYPWRSHTMQVQINRWVVNHAERWLDETGTPADIPFNPREWRAEHLYLVYLGPRGPKTLEVMATKDVLTPTGAKVRRRVPDVWDDEYVTDLLFPRLSAMALALEAYPEWPFGDQYKDVPPDSRYLTGFEGPPGWACPGKPWCMLPNCLAKRWPAGLIWSN